MLLRPLTHISKLLYADGVDISYPEFRAVCSDLALLREELGGVDIPSAYEELKARLGGADGIPRFARTLVPQPAAVTVQ